VAAIDAASSSRAVNWRSSASPAAGPSESFTSVKSSRLTNITPTVRPNLAEHLIASSRSFENIVRLGSPVSGS
jgi:hypothetical protein